MAQQGGRAARDARLLAIAASVAPHIGWLYGTAQVPLRVAEVAREVSEDFVWQVRVLARAATESMVYGIRWASCLCKWSSLALVVCAAVWPLSSVGWSKLMYIVHGIAPESLRGAKQPKAAQSSTTQPKAAQAT